MKDGKKIGAGAAVAVLGAVWLLTREKKVKAPSASLLAAIQLAGATYLDGVITDGSTGAPIDDVRVELWSADNTTMVFATATWDGEYLFPDMAPGSYVLHLIKDGYATVSKAVTVKAGENRLDATMTPVAVEMTVESLNAAQAASWEAGNKPTVEQMISDPGFGEAVMSGPYGSPEVAEALAAAQQTIGSKPANIFGVVRDSISGLPAPDVSVKLYSMSHLGEPWGEGYIASTKSTNRNTYISGVIGFYRMPSMGSQPIASGVRYLLAAYKASIDRILTDEEYTITAPSYQLKVMEIVLQPGDNEINLSMVPGSKTLEGHPILTT